MGAVGRRLARLTVTARLMLRHPIDFFTYLAHQATAYDRHQLVRRGDIDRLIDAAIEERLRVFMNSPPIALLPQVSLEDIYEAKPEPVALPLETHDESELPENERRAVAHIVSVQRPDAIFEIGTYRGRTTRLLAACSPSAIVHTIDLPPESMLEGGCFRESDPRLIGTRYKEDASLGSRVVQHFGDTREFDFKPYYGQMDLVFVDASHAYEAVLNDSREAFQMLRPGGVVLWDDYHPIHGSGVMRALADLVFERSPVWIKGTRLAIYRSPEEAPSRP